MATAKSKTTKKKPVTKVTKASTAKTTKKAVPKTAAKPAPKSHAKVAAKTGAKSSVKKAAVAKTAKVAKVAKHAKVTKVAKPAAKSPVQTAKKPTQKTVPKTATKGVPKSAPKAAPKVEPKASAKPALKVAAKPPLKLAGKGAAKAAPLPVATTHAASAGGPKFASNVPASPPPRAAEKPVVKAAPQPHATVHLSTVRVGGLLSESELVKQAKTDYMSSQQLAFFKHRLLQLQAELRENAGATTEHLREIAVAPDPADRATLEEEHALELRTRDRERKLLKKVEAALVRIEDGSYGYCEETGEPIGIQRLLARPTATLTIEAQERREMKQKMYGE